ncbi:MAG: hypothetical protein R3223_07200 [Longimicrobiales bacterium]|nr:hypothetical protein [Longimicrobiales bacterium]
MNGRRRGRRGAIRGFAGSVCLVLGIGGCGPAVPADEAPPLSEFQLNAPVSGRVLENVTACEVDADCFLRIEFADTVITALYGAGERPRPPCEIGVDVSDRAFGVDEGQTLSFEIARCGDEGLYVVSLGSQRQDEGSVE